MSEQASTDAAGTGSTPYPVPSRIRYADPTYWNERYQKHPDQFDWFHNWYSLRKLLREFLKKGEGACVVVRCRAPFRLHRGAPWQAVSSQTACAFMCVCVCVCRQAHHSRWLR